MTTRKQEMMHALRTARKNNVVSLTKDNDYIIIGYSEEIKFEAGERIRDFIEKGWNEVI